MLRQMLSDLVAQRTQEIGVRLALGANRNQIVWMMVRQGLTMALIGTAFGLFGAIGAQRIMSTLLYGVSAMDPLTLVTAAVLMLIVSVTACVVPAYRASTIDPLQALRFE